MNKEILKKNIIFIFTFYFPVGFLVYYFENFYFICISRYHYFRPPFFQTFPLGDIGINFCFFFYLFFINCTIKSLEKKNKNKYFISFIYGVFVTMIGTLFELIYGLLCLKIFNFSFWNYSELAYNYKGLIALEISFIYFILGCLYFLLGYDYLFKFKKLFDEILFEKLMKKKFLLVVISLTWIIYLGDIFYNIYQNHLWEKDLKNKEFKFHPWRKYAKPLINTKN